MKTLIFAVTVVAVSAAQADTIHVDAANCPGPGDGSVGDPYCSIQTAIDNAVDTDEIVVAPGTYFEAIDFLGKAIWSHSSDGPEVTIIDAALPAGEFGSVVSCRTGEGPGSVLQGFTITGGWDFLGGGMYNDCSNPTVIGCVFSNNVAYNGGGMYNAISSPTVIACTFSGNTATNVGGGMYNANSSPTVTNCTFSGNSAINSGGGMRNWNSSSPTVTNCAFSGNSAINSGGGMANLLSSPTVSNCTFTGNSAMNGIALAFDSTNQKYPSDLTMTNCILWDGGDEIWNNDGSNIDLKFSDIDGGWPGIGNIDTDPLFVDPDNGDFRLQAGSPCIDTGDNTAVHMGVLRDLDGNPRFVADACAGESGAIVDMGAYEFQGTSCDLSSLMQMLAAWGSCDECGNCPSDFDGDCSVGILDFLILLGNWG